MSQGSERIASLAVEGLTSMAPTKIVLEPETTLSIGTNGSGKSNRIKNFELLSRVVEKQLQRYVALRGGMDSLLHVSPATGQANVNPVTPLTSRPTFSPESRSSR